jgi:hypothetical protein
VLFDRVRKLNSAEARKSGQYVLYWAQMNHRVESNHALSFAVDTANELNVLVLFYEDLTRSCPEANDRFPIGCTGQDDHRMVGYSRGCARDYDLSSRSLCLGRTPNTYSNILWCLGLHERPIFGMMHYMTLDGMRRKTDVDAYTREVTQGTLL